MYARAHTQKSAGSTDSKKKIHKRSSKTYVKQENTISLMRLVHLALWVTTLYVLVVFFVVIYKLCQTLLYFE